MTIRDGRVGGEGREGEEYAVVSADGSLPLPPAAIGAFPPGALVRVHEVDGVWTLIPQDGGDPGRTDPREHTPQRSWTARSCSTA